MPGLGQRRAAAGTSAKPARLASRPPRELAGESWAHVVAGCGRPAETAVIPFGRAHGPTLTGVPTRARLVRTELTVPPQDQRQRRKLASFCPKPLNRFRQAAPPTTA